MPDNSFDVVSLVDIPEVLNAVQQARKEVQTRFDLKDSKSEIELNEKDKKIVITSVDDFKLRAVVEILQQKLAKRKVPLKNFTLVRLPRLRDRQRGRKLRFRRAFQLRRRGISLRKLKTVR